MDLFKNAQQFLKLAFSAELLKHKGTDVSVPIQLRSSLEVQSCTINKVPFECLLFDNERVLNESSSNLFRKLIERFEGKNLLVLKSSLKAQSMKFLRSLKVGYIVPGESCYIPQFMLQTNKEDYQKKEPLSGFSANILIQYLEGQISSRIASNEIEIEGSRMSKSRSLSELEERGLVDIIKQGRINIVSFNKTRKQLWGDREKLLTANSKGPYLIPKNELTGLKGLVFAGESALSMYTLLSQPKIKSYAIYRAAGSEGELYKRVRNYVSHFDAYGSIYSSELVEVYLYDIKPRLRKVGPWLLLSPISLLLSDLSPKDERAYSCLAEVNNKVLSELDKLDAEDAIIESGKINEKF
ncbi:hypothetical protein [Pseudoalteromonas sp. Ps84H-4]|uniref:hypothetical protein n=1 Tax=Pseudoalteromonas sp. Ps84H-4 TaxID=2954502 RepID=UPI00209828FA|nr:hypothetical protein [Pseudoalteromonas sp. Ps84H-4]MCO7248826.1 hypothetical protein [Pseudoalteromonas sp. Ps84H-4]